jgi:hypothetical protein
MKCLGCPLKYIGQTGRTLNIRYTENIQAFRSSNSNSEYSNHKLNTRHAFGTITDTMDIVTGKKGKYLIALKYHIYSIIIRALRPIATHTTPVVLQKRNSSHRTLTEERERQCLCVSRCVYETHCYINNWK